MEPKRDIEDQSNDRSRWFYWKGVKNYVKHFSGQETLKKSNSGLLQTQSPHLTIPHNIIEILQSRVLIEDHRALPEKKAWRSVKSFIQTLKCIDMRHIFTCLGTSAGLK